MLGLVCLLGVSEHAALVISAKSNMLLVPDFRSTEGLFKTLKDTHNLKGSGKQLFDASVYRDANSTSHFHDMVREMSTLSRTAKPTPFHHLVARLAHEGRLLRLYSQNIDGLEVSLPPLQTVAPLPSKGPWPKTVQVHGGLEKMVCTKCQHTSDFQPELFDGPVPPLCSICEELDLVRTEVAGKRSHGVGRLRPRMVLYNEHNPDQDSIGSVSNADLRTRPDAVIVVGTSCKIPGIRRIVREMCGVVRDRRDGLTVWINNDPVPTGKDLESCWDLVVKGTADEVADRAGLGHWDDPEIEVESVAEANVQAAKENNIQVVVESPKKATKHFDPITDALATAKAQAESEWEEEKAANVPALTLSSELTTALKMPPPTKGRPKAASKGKLKNPASQGMSIDMFLNQKVRGTATQVKQESVVPEAPATKPGTTKPTLAPTKKSATTKKATKPAAPRKSRAKPKTKQTADAAGSSTKLNFKVTKASATAKTASTAKQPAGKRKEVPSAPPSRRESTLDDISDSSARVNSACTSPTSENGVDAKDAGAVKAGKTTGILGLAASDVGSLMGGTS